MTTQVRGKAFGVLGKIEHINEMLTSRMRGLYHLGWHHSLGGLSVRDEFSGTILEFYAGGVRDFSRVAIKTRKNHDKFTEQEVTLKKPYWLKAGETAVVTNENNGEQVRLTITRERPASVQDRSRR